MRPWSHRVQVTAELEKLEVSPEAIAAIFEVVRLTDVADLSRLLGHNSEVRRMPGFSHDHRPLA